MPRVISTSVVAQRGIGRPDYQEEVSRGKQIFAYEPEFGETYLWLIALFVPVPGPSAVTLPGIAAGATAQAIDAFTGLTQLNVAAGWDYVIKEFWVSFNQDTEFVLFQGGSYNDTACICYVPGGNGPINIFQTGWSRSLLEDITLPSVLRCDITNLGGAVAYGKVWCIGYMKEGTYLWI